MPSNERLLLLCAALAVAPGARAQTVVTFPGCYSCVPSAIVAGPGGNIWFLPGNLGGSAMGPQPAPQTIAAMTADGTLTTFSLPNPNSGPADITSGPDGNLWFTDYGANGIGRITPAGVVTSFTLPTTGSNPLGICSGSDGNLWFAEGAGRIGRITPAGTIQEFPFQLPAPPPYPRSIASGPDGNVWFTENAPKIGRITPTGVVQEFSLPDSADRAVSIAPGPDGNLWFTEDGPVSAVCPPLPTFNIARITPDGAVTEFPVPWCGDIGYGRGIAAGPDGNVWFASATGTGFGRITPAGSITLFDPLSPLIPYGGIGDIAFGPDGNLWSTLWTPRVFGCNMCAIPPAYVAKLVLSSCFPDANTLCLNNGRFEVQTQWTDFQGNTGPGKVVPGVSSPDSGLFWFFGPDNWEMLLKVLNGCAVNNHYWVFGAATTDVSYTIHVTDTQSGAVRTYTNPLGTASPAITDTSAFASCP